MGRGDKSQVDATGPEHQGGTLSSVLFSPKLDDSERAFETVVFFSMPKDSFIPDPEIIKNGKKGIVSLWLLPAG